MESRSSRRGRALRWVRVRVTVTVRFRVRVRVRVRVRLRGSLRTAEESAAVVRSRRRSDDSRATSLHTRTVGAAGEGNTIRGVGSSRRGAQEARAT